MSRVNASPGKRALDRAVKQAMVYFNEVRDADDAYVPFEQHSDYADKLKVFSFTFSSQHYNVSVEWDGPSLKHIRSSSCERQHQTNECCKHIGILLYLFEGSSFVGNPHHGLTSEQTDEQSVEQLAVASQEPLNLETGYDTRDLEEASEFLTRCFLEKKYGEWSAEAASLVKRTRDAFEEMYDAGEGGKRRAREDKQYRRQRS
ncbi:hypothetical protein DFQ27_000552 [Actinomortierella ambigua]|uniref:Uncharacterized protein n=1 Tax=Actinomortierella ambigua TaxID=1343610 RepID=A0A9P6U8T2_9FUNG|nr:hypothetical protein DFQ27_000552 [Actinomortierella ambigua]